jgi:hypothetical protein
MPGGGPWRSRRHLDEVDAVARPDDPALERLEAGGPCRAQRLEVLRPAWGRRRPSRQRRGRFRQHATGRCAVESFGWKEGRWFPRIWLFLTAARTPEPTAGFRPDAHATHSGRGITRPSCAIVPASSPARSDHYLSPAAAPISGSLHAEGSKEIEPAYCPRACGLNQYSQDKDSTR